MNLIWRCDLCGYVADGYHVRILISMQIILFGLETRRLKLEKKRQTFLVYKVVDFELCFWFLKTSHHYTTRKRAMKISVSYYTRHQHSALILKSWYQPMCIGFFRDIMNCKDPDRYYNGFNGNTLMKCSISQSCYLCIIFIWIHYNFILNIDSKLMVHAQLPNWWCIWKINI